jgi:hypothetical protein
MNITEFVASIDKLGFVQSNKFEVLIFPPKILDRLRSIIPGDSRLITAYCESSTVPGLNVQTSDLIRYGIGPTEQKPFRVAFDNWGCTFLGDGRGELLSFFQNWIKSIVNFTTTGKAVDTKDPISGLGAYEVAYKDDYRTQIIVSVFDNQRHEVIRVKLIQAYPIAIQSIPVSRGAENDIMKFNVVFSYLEWTNEFAFETAQAVQSISNENTEEFGFPEDNGIIQPAVSEDTAIIRSSLDRPITTKT